MTATRPRVHEVSKTAPTVVSTFTWTRSATLTATPQAFLGRPGFCRWLVGSFHA